MDQATRKKAVERLLKSKAEEAREKIKYDEQERLAREKNRQQGRTWAIEEAGFGDLQNLAKGVVSREPRFRGPGAEGYKEGALEVWDELKNQLVPPEGND